MPDTEAPTTLPWVVPDTEPVVEPSRPEPDLPRPEPQTPPDEQPFIDPCRCPGT